MIVPLWLWGWKLLSPGTVVHPGREPAGFVLFTTSEFFLGAFPGGEQQNWCGGLCHLETAFQVIRMHIPTKNQPPALTPFSVQMRNWGPNLKVTWWHRALVGWDTASGSPRRARGVTLCLILWCLSFQQLCICLVRTYQSPHSTPAVRSCHFCHLALCTVFGKPHPKPTPPHPGNSQFRRVVQGWSKGSHFHGFCGWFKSGHAINSHPIKPINLYCEFPEEGPSTLFLLSWSQQEVESGWPKPSNHY